MKKAKAKQVAKAQEIPLPLNEADKVVLLDKLVQLQKDIEDKNKALDDMKADHKEKQSVLVKELTSMANESEECLKAAVMEYLGEDDDEKVLYSRPMKDTEWQLETGDWTIGDPATAKFAAESGVAVDDEELPV